MNPFDLSGPDFLVFYSVLVLAACGAVLFRAREPVTPLPGFDMADPYAIAYLRGGPAIMVRVAVMSLIHRGLVAIEVDRLQVTEAGRAQAKASTLDGAILDALLNTPKWTMDSAVVRAPTAEHLQRLKSALEAGGALKSLETRNRLHRISIIAALVLLAVAALRISLALARGHHNVLYLVSLCALGMWAAVWLAWSKPPHRTRSGSALLRNLQRVYGDVYVARSRPEEAQADAHRNLLLLAAVFGLNAVPSVLFPHVRMLMPLRPVNGDSSDSLWDNDRGGSDSGGGVDGGGGDGGGADGCGGCSGH